MTATHQTKTLIIGSGPAGYTAAIYAARANLQPILVQGMQPGGQLTITTDVENYPGFADIVQGPWLMEQMAAQATKVGTKLLFDMIKEVDFSQRPFRCLGESGDAYVADTIIIATGAQARWLGLASETEFQGHGVSGCATCDGFFFRGKEVAVIGGGNSALEEALYLTNHASKVTIVHRRDRFRGEKILHDRVFAHPKIKVVWNSTVEAIVGETEPAKKVTGVKLRDMQSNTVTTLPVDGIFVAIGHDPATGIFKGKVKMDEAGYILTAPDSTATDIPGLFAAGMGCMAALEAERFLAGGGH